MDFALDYIPAGWTLQQAVEHARWHVVALRKTVRDNGYGDWYWTAWERLWDFQSLMSKQWGDGPDKPFGPEIQVVNWYS